MRAGQGPTERGEDADEDQSQWDQRARHETREEQLDRNLGEMVQELRVAQMGVQFLFAALLAIPFQQRFKDLTDFQRDAYASTLVLTLASAILLVAPASFHRIVFRQRVKAELIAASQRLMLAGLATLALAMTSALVLVLDVVTGRHLLFWLVVVGAMAAFLAVWYAWPLSVRARAGKESR
jgi:Family of unknown function (DUF6328)